MIATIAALASDFHIILQSRWPFWLLAATMLIGVALVIYLYNAQRAIASRVYIIILTALRIMLLALVALMIYQPAIEWTHTQQTSGTLWLLLDQSSSMGMKDPQATTLERMRWAAALGKLPRAVEVSPLSGIAADIRIARSTLAQAQPDSTALRGNAGEEQRQELLKQLKQSRTTLSDIHDRINSNDPQTSAVRQSLKRALQIIDQAITDTTAAATLSDANNVIGWGVLLNNLDSAATEAQATADKTDGLMIARHNGTPAFEAALASVANLSRAELARAAIMQASQDQPGLKAVLEKYRVKVISVAQTAQSHAVMDHHVSDDTLHNALDPHGQATDLAAGLAMIGDQLTPQEPASVLMVTDGGHNTKNDPTEPARLLAARGVRIFGLLVGSHQVSSDAAVDQTNAPDWIYKDDTLKAAALVRLDGLAGKPIKVELLRGDTVIDTQTVVASSNQATERVSFSDKPSGDKSVYDYHVRVEVPPNDVNPQNNQQNFRVAVKKDKLAALMIDSYARWEFQYLQNYLERDQRLKLQSVLLHVPSVRGVPAASPVRASPDNPRVEAQILPETREQWQAFDVIILGDVPPDALPPAQLHLIASAVRDHGSMLIIIPGREYMPSAYLNSPLLDLLPVENTNPWLPDELSSHLTAGFRPGLAPESAGSVLTQLGLDAAQNQAIWSQMPAWYWHTPQTLAKPGAAVVWYIAERDNRNAAAPVSETTRKRALISTMNVGLGRVMYLASDQTWRLRQVGGENIHERFWGQVIRWAVGNDLPAGGRFVRFGAARSRYVSGEPVTVTIRVQREDYTPGQQMKFDVVARLADDKDQRVVGQVTAVETPEAPGYYRATLGGLPAGNVEITLRGADVERLLDQDPTVTLRSLVIPIAPTLDLERRNMNTNPAMLANITAAGNGAMADGAYAANLAHALPQLQREVHSTQQVGMFTAPDQKGSLYAHWIFLAAFVLVITAEWIVRKIAGMV